MGALPDSLRPNDWATVDESQLNSGRSLLPWRTVWGISYDYGTLLSLGYAPQHSLWLNEVLWDYNRLHFGGVESGMIVF